MILIVVVMLCYPNRGGHDVHPSCGRVVMILFLVAMMCHPNRGGHVVSS